LGGNLRAGRDQGSQKRKREETEAHGYEAHFRF
jgi:hypothetical protein